MEAPIHILSLGAGVQSSTMALMAASREIQPMPTCAVFADTHDEPKAVYAHLDWLEEELPFPVYRVTRGDLMSANLKVVRSKKSGKLYMGGKIPAFVLKPDGKVGLLGRKCTADFKIEPIHKKARELAGPRLKAWRKKHRLALQELALRTKNKMPKDLDGWNEMQDDALVEMWIGISMDEAIRAKPSRVPWIRNTWPLLEARKSRDGCLAWLKANGFPVAPRSACKKCPFHGDEEWAMQTPEEFAESVEYERQMQLAARSQEALTGIPFLHESCKPLDQIDFKKLASSGKAQLNMFGNECEGLCGV